MRRNAALAAVTALIAVALAGCSAGNVSVGKFVRYEKMQNGQTAAVVTVDNSTELAWVKLTDLKAGDAIDIQYEGGNWDKPQWMPVATVVGHVGR
jgi:hypothetical protein